MTPVSEHERLTRSTRKQEQARDEMPDDVYADLLAQAMQAQP